MITRLFTPEAMGGFTSFTTVAATLAVVACGRYEFALPMARQEGDARALLALCLRIWLAVTVLCLPVGWALARWAHLPLPALLPLCTAAPGPHAALGMDPRMTTTLAVVAVHTTAMVATAVTLAIGAALLPRRRSNA